MTMKKQFKPEIKGRGHELAKVLFGKGKRLPKEGSVNAEKQRVIDFAENMKREEMREKEFFDTITAPLKRTIREY